MAHVKGIQEDICYEKEISHCSLLRQWQLQRYWQAVEVKIQVHLTVERNSAKESKVENEDDTLIVGFDGFSSDGL